MTNRDNAYRVSGLLVFFLLVGCCLTPGTQGQTAKRLWVLGEGGEIVEYDPVSFEVRKTLPAALRVLHSPESLRISSRGQILWSPLLGDRWDEPTHSSRTPANLWLHDGGTTRTIPGRTKGPTDLIDRDKYVEELQAQAFLASDGTALFWFEQQFQRLMDGHFNIERAVELELRILQSNLAGEDPRTLAEVRLPQCECATGVCSETCPEFDYWIPEEGLHDFFFVTQVIPGQLGSTRQSSFLYERKDGDWTSKELPQALESVLDAAQRGTLLVERVEDGGCCGWNNESSDRTLLHANGGRTVLFDEFQRYHNQDYDISFYTPLARLSPGRDRVAYTIASTSRPGEEIRLADRGVPAAATLQQVRHAVMELPMVEVVRVDDPSPPLLRIPHASLVGWWNDRQILLYEDGPLVLWDLQTGDRIETPIQAPSQAHIYLR